MFKLTITAALIAAATAASVTINQLVAVQPSFESFKGQFGKAYVSENEHAKRSAIYADNVAFMDAHNAKFAAGEQTFDMGVNEFSDLSQ
jgi:cathepsin L